MPTAPKSVCRCGGLVSDGVCDRCGPRREAPRARRNKLYDTREWRDRTQPGYLSDHPFCADCSDKGRTRLATQVHHVEKAEDNPDRAHDYDNLRALCAECHSARTRKGE